MSQRASARQALLAAVAGLVFIGAVIGAVNQNRTDELAAPSVRPTTTTTATSVPAPVVRPGLAGFSSVGYSTVDEKGVTQNRCALLAELPDQQARGMMGQRDLGGHDAMVFPFPTGSSARFFMANVPVPLSIAWYGTDGAFLESADMPLCPDPANCPRFGPNQPFRFAFETLLGGLDAAGLKAGSKVTVGGPCL